MTAESRLGKQLEELIATLGSIGAPFALIGGLALAPYRVIRATQDVDLLTDAATFDAVHEALVALGYECLHRSADAGNYLRGDERVDFILAHRPAALGLLRDARPMETDFGPLRVVSVEGLIGLKLQGFVNNPHLFADGGLAPDPKKTEANPFRALDDLMVVVEALCPTWPVRPTFEHSTRFLL